MEDLGSRADGPQHLTLLIAGRRRRTDAGCRGDRLQDRADRGDHLGQGINPDRPVVVGDGDQLPRDRGSRVGGLDRPHLHLQAQVFGRLDPRHDVFFTAHDHEGVDLALVRDGAHVDDEPRVDGLLLHLPLAAHQPTLDQAHARDAPHADGARVRQLAGRNGRVIPTQPQDGATGCRDLLAQHVREPLAVDGQVIHPLHPVEGAHHPVDIARIDKHHHRAAHLVASKD